MRRISSSALVEVQNALESYRQEVERSQLKRSAKDTYIPHAARFVRWLDGRFEPGGTLKGKE